MFSRDRLSQLFPEKLHFCRTHFFKIGNYSGIILKKRKIKKNQKKLDFVILVA